MDGYMKTRMLAKATIHELDPDDKPSLILASSASKEDALAVEAKKEKFDAQKDLMKMVSVLVSVGKNRNGDVFLADELAKVSASGKDKPINIEHDSDHIIGHMTRTYPSSKSDGAEIDLKKPPKDFDITNEAVIYAFVKPKVADAIRKLAAAGKLFVSVEMWFKDYDFLVGSKVVKRNQATSFLDSCLATNGGDGTYKGQPIGRVLREMLIGGMGVVEKPANPDSVIKSVANESRQGVRDVSMFSEPALASNIIEDLGSEAEPGQSVTEGSKMPENIMKEIADTVKASIEAATKQAVEDAKKQSQPQEQPKAQATEQPKPAAQATDAVIETLRASLNDLSEKFRALSAEMASVKQANEALGGKLRALEQSQVVAQRRAALAGLGMSDELVDRRMAKAASMTKEDFDSYIADVKEIFNARNLRDAAASEGSEKTEKGGESRASEGDVKEKTEVTQEQASDEDAESLVIDASELEDEDADVGAAAPQAAQGEPSLEEKFADAIVSKLAGRNKSWAKMAKASQEDEQAED